MNESGQTALHKAVQKDAICFVVLYLFCSLNMQMFVHPTCRMLKHFTVLYTTFPQQNTKIFASNWKEKMYALAWFNDVHYDENRRDGGITY